MKGTEKQIKWANDIKDEVMLSISLIRKQFDKFYSPSGEFTQDLQKFETCDIDALENVAINFFEKADASTIIDRRKSFRYEGLVKMCHNHYMQRCANK